MKHSVLWVSRYRTFPLLPVVAWQLYFFVSPAFRGRSSRNYRLWKAVSRTCKVGGKNTASPPGEDDFSTTPGGLDLACTSRTRVTFACELRGFGYGMAVMSAVYVSWNDRDILCPKITGNHEKMLPLHQEKRVIWKHEEYSDSKQLGIFLSVARSHASFLQSVDNQIRYFRLQQI